jgi:hypothetical protein
MSLGPLNNKNGRNLHYGLFASVGYFADSRLICAVGTAVKDAVALDAMPNYFAAAVGTLWSHRLNCTFKAIEGMGLTRCRNFKCFVIFIAAGFTACHRKILLQVKAND